MQIEYLTTKSRREVSEAAGRALIKHKIARAVETPHVELTAEPDEISPRTGRPKRQYRRRDLRAED